MKKLLKIMSQEYSPLEMLSMLEKLWFIGKSAQEIIGSLESEFIAPESSQLLLSFDVPKQVYTGDPFGKSIDWPTVFSFALHPYLQIGLKKKNIWAIIVFHKPVIINGDRHLLGFDINPTGPKGLFGRIDFWNVESSRKWNFFPKPKSGEFLFVTDATNLS